MPGKLEQLIAQGEGLDLEFKRCGALPGKDVFETVCSFANRQGGRILLGVTDSGSVEGVNENARIDIERNIANVISNPNLFNTSPTIEFDHAYAQDKLVIIVWIPMGPSVYRYKGVAYDRIADVDVKIKSDEQISAMYIRKQNLYTEQRVFPYVGKGDLRLDLLPKIRSMVKANRSNHPWLPLADDDLLKAARLYTKDQQTGEWGFNLAAIMLLGNDDTILSASPVYRTDATLRRIDIDRYDDRLTVNTNLIESYELLSDFCKRWLPNSFVLDRDRRVNARDIIVRELVVNTLMHREYVSPFISQLTIDGEGIRTRNPSRCLFAGAVSPDNLAPTPKNPIIANFFTQIGLAEELGSGTRNLFKYAKLYSNKEPVMTDGDFFDAFIPVPKITGEKKPQITSLNALQVSDPIQRAIIHLLETNDSITAREVAELSNANPRTVRRRLADLVESELLVQEGAGRSTAYRKGHLA